MLSARPNEPVLSRLSRLVEGEALRRKDRATQRRIQVARFPVIKSLEQFNWTWPKKINRPHVQNLFRLSFLKDKANIIFMGGAGLGKTHLGTALAYECCLAGHTVLFTTAVDIVNTLAAAQSTHRLKAELRKYINPDLVLIDELGYLPLKCPHTSNQRSVFSHDSRPSEVQVGLSWKLARITVAARLKNGASTTGPTMTIHFANGRLPSLRLSRRFTVDILPVPGGSTRASPSSLSRKQGP